MNVYIEIIIRLANDHLTDKEKRLVAERLNVPLTGPGPMTDVQILRNNFRQGILSRKKRKS